MVKGIFAKIKEELPDVQKNILLKDYTTYKIGGPAKYFFNAKNKEDLIKAVKIAKELKLPIFILAGGSNILVSDKGFNGLVIKMQNVHPPKFCRAKIVAGKNLKMKNKNAKCKIINVDAGVMLSKLVGFTVENSLTGFEWALGIPGTVGGAVFGSAQAFGDKISDSVEKVEALDLRTLKIKKLSKKQCKFSLKNSRFKKDKNSIIVSVLLKLKKGDKAQIQKKIIEYLNYRKKNHPIEYPSVGSVFINPEIAIKNRGLLEKFPELKNLIKKEQYPLVI